MNDWLTDREIKGDSIYIYQSNSFRGWALFISFITLNNLFIGNILFLPHKSYHLSYYFHAFECKISILRLDQGVCVSRNTYFYWLKYVHWPLSWFLWQYKTPTRLKISLPLLYCYVNSKLTCTNRWHIQNHNILFSKILFISVVRRSHENVMQRSRSNTTNWKVFVLIILYYKTVTDNGRNVGT